MLPRGEKPFALAGARTSGPAYDSDPFLLSRMNVHWDRRGASLHRHIEREHVGPHFAPRQGQAQGWRLDLLPDLDCATLPALRPTVALTSPPG